MASSLFFRGAATTAVLAALGGSVAATTGLASCISTGSYVYTAQKYDPAADCVSAYAPVEVVNGSGASATCPAACLMVGVDLYVSTLCPPLPAIASAVDRDAGTCVAALKAAAKGGTCDVPLVTEGGAADGSAEDAARDGGVDAEGVDAADAAAVKDAADAG